MKAAVEIITPAFAKQLLEQGAKNRPMTKDVVQKYASDMIAGRWENNGQGIILSDAGELMDGQHRCAAIILAGIPVSMMVVRGVPVDRFATLDGGKPRKLRGILALDGHLNSLALSSAATAAISYIGGVGMSSKSVTRAQGRAFIEAHPYLAEVTNQVSRVRSPVSRPALAAVMFLGNHSRRFDDEVELFIGGVSDGVGLYHGDPRLTLRNWHTLVTSSKRAKPYATFGAIARAWSSFAVGDALKIIRLPDALSQRTLKLYGFDRAAFADIADAAEPEAPIRSNLPKDLATPPLGEVLGAP